MQALKPAFVLSTVLVLQGCAGLNELAYSDLVRPQASTPATSSEFVPQGYTGTPAVANQAQMANRAIANNSSVSSTTMTSVVTNDPINAPPPPMTGQTDIVPVSSPTPSRRPMMLVPAPGETQESFSVGVPAQADLPMQLPAAPAETQFVSPLPASAPISVNEPVSSAVAEMPSTASSNNSSAVLPAFRAASSSIGREFIPATISPSGLSSETVNPGDIRLTRGQQNVLARFSVLERLLDEGLVTRNERDQRRAENIGAILPYTHAAPASTLEREVPSGDAISARLSSLKRSLELRVITPRQHSMERSMILDALLPSEPRVRSAPVPPPEDVIAAAGMIGQLERLRFERVISNAEFEQERAAIDKYLMTGTIPQVGIADDLGAQAAVMSAPMATLPQSSLRLHLASYRSQEAAETGWKSISKKYSAQLGGLNSVIRRVNLGANKGTFYRLMAGPVSDDAQAKSICQQLKRSNQYCDPLNLDG